MPSQPHPLTPPPALSCSRSVFAEVAKDDAASWGVVDAIAKAIAQDKQKPAVLRCEVAP